MAIRLDPHLASAHHNRAAAHETQNRYDRALVDYDEIVRAHPTDPRAWNNRCWMRAIVGQLEAAIDDCEEALRLEPERANTLDSRGLVHLLLGVVSRPCGVSGLARRRFDSNALWR